MYERSKRLCLQVIARDRAGIPNPTSGKLLRQAMQNLSADTPWTKVPKFHVKNLSIQYELAGGKIQNVKALGHQ